jgi:hypothetical protein
MDSTESNANLVCHRTSIRAEKQHSLDHLNPDPGLTRSQPYRNTEIDALSNTSDTGPTLLARTRDPNSKGRKLFLFNPNGHRCRGRHFTPFARFDMIPPAG